jgi:hypothetical protein
MNFITRFFTIFLFIIISSGLAFSQGIRAVFDEGKALLEQQQYALALGKFEQVRNFPQENELTQYATYYQAIAAYYSGDPSLGKALFSQVERKYADWDVMDELNFWIAKIEFEDGNTRMGLDYLLKINNQDFAKDKVDLKTKFIREITDISKLKTWVEEDQDTVVAARLLAELLKLEVSKQDLNLIDQIIRDFDIVPEVVIVGVERSVKKEIYNIGLFFPFQFQNDSLGIARMANEWPTSFLQGMKLGLEKLKEENLSINLMTFDTRTSASVTRQILSDPALKELDLIVGPAYQGPLSEVARFAKENKINFVNPISSNGEILLDNPFAFLYYPSNESMAIEAAKYAKANFRKNKNVAIFYASEADRLRADLYRKIIEKDSFNVVINQMVKSNESVKIQQMFVEDIKVDKDTAIVSAMLAEMDSLLQAGVPGWEKYTEDDFKIDTLRILPDSIGHIFIASDLPTLSASAISGIDARQDTIFYIGSSRWLSSEQSISFAQLERVGAVFTGANWIDYDRQEVKEFRLRYLERFSAFPRKEERLGDAYLGYDVMVTFSRLLHKHGKYFQFGIKSKEKVKGELTEAFDYRLTNDNRYIPILKMIDSKVQNSNN